MSPAPHVMEADAGMGTAWAPAPLPLTSTLGWKSALAELHATRISVATPVTARRAPRGSLPLANETTFDSAVTTGFVSPPVASANVYEERILISRAGSTPAPVDRYAGSAVAG